MQHERQQDEPVAVPGRVQLHLDAVHCHALHVQFIVCQIVLLPRGGQSDGLVAVEEALLLVRVSVGRSLAVTICREWGMVGWLEKRREVLVYLWVFLFS